MKRFIKAGFVALVLAASATAALAMPRVPASAIATDSSDAVVLVKGGHGHGHGHMGRGGRGHHYGWGRGRGHHYGWSRGRHHHHSTELPGKRPRAGLSLVFATRLYIAIGSGVENLFVPTTVSAMPGLIGYMLAIVITLGVYLAGLHWLVNPPDPWQSGPKIPTRTAQQSAAKKRLPPIVKPAEAGESLELATPAEPDTKSASIETSVPVETRESETAQPTKQSMAEADLARWWSRCAPYIARFAQRRPDPAIASESREMRAVNWN